MAEKSGKTTARRTQAERSEATQRKIVESALRLIRREGFQRANLQNIARGAKVTLGGVQHHFGTRQALMERIVDEVMAPLSERGDVWPPTSLPLDERAREFVRRAWATTYGPANYVTAWSLFFGCKSSPTLFKRIDAKRAIDSSAFSARFLEHFPEVLANHEDAGHLADFVFSSLRGIALLHLFNVADETTSGQLEVLAGTIVHAGTASVSTRYPARRSAKR